MLGPFTRHSKWVTILHQIVCCHKSSHEYIGRPTIYPSLYVILPSNSFPNQKSILSVNHVIRISYPTQSPLSKPNRFRTKKKTEKKRMKEEKEKQTIQSEQKASLNFRFPSRVTSNKSRTDTVIPSVNNFEMASKKGKETKSDWRGYCKNTKRPC